MTIQETWADKISKLLRKAESTDSAEEAEAFYSKAQELMAKYAIDEAMLAAARDFKDVGANPIIKQEFVIYGIYRYPLMNLCFAVLRNNGLKAVLLYGSPWRTVGGRVYKETQVLDAVGYKTDLERASLLYTSLQLQALRAENIWWKEHKPLYSHLKPSKQHQARRGFLFAFAEGANKKLAEATQRGKKAAETEHGSDSVALVIRDKSLKVQDEFNKHYPSTVSLKDRKNHGDQFARSHGYEAGQRADVGQSNLGGNRKEINR